MIGKTISHYRILEKLGEGGMGVVYRAEDTKLRRTVALKFLSPKAIGTDEDKTRFIHEAQAAAALNHPNICTVYEIDESDGQTFIAMECVDGESLSDRIGSGRLSIDEALGVAIQVAEGLEKAHEKKIIHRDIKSGNIMVTSDGKAKVMDFGLAKLATGTKVTRTGATVGTAAYMSPEQAMGDVVDHRTDVWSLGVVLYEMVAGRLPFRGDYEQAVLYSILNEEPEPLHSVRSGTPAGIENVVKKAMQKHAADRYPDLGSMLEDLRRAKAGGEVKVRLPAIRRRRKSIAVGVGLIALAAVMVLVWPAIRQRLGVGGAEAKTLAVVDFDNIGAEDAGHLASGLAEGISVKLSKLSGIRVVSSDDIRRLRKDGLPAREVASRLGAQYAICGSLMQSGKKIRITPQLVKASSGDVVWTELFDRDFNDVFAFLDEVSVKIVHALRVELSPAERGALQARGTDSPEAYDHYLRGREFHYRTTVKDNEQAEKELGQALRIEPDYPLALAGLADVYVQRYKERYDCDEHWLDEADRLIGRALARDEGLAEAYESRAEALLEKENYLGAMVAAKKARSLRPGWDEPYLRLGETHQARGEGRLALEMFNKALEIRPSVEGWCGRGQVFERRGLVDSAEVAYRRAMAINPTHDRPLYDLGKLYYLRQGDLDEGERMLRRATEVRPDRGRSYESLTYLLLYHRNRLQEAETLVRRFADTYRYNRDAYEVLFNLLSSDKGDDTAALKAVQGAVARNPGKVWPYLLLAQAYSSNMAENPEPQKALEALRKAMELRPGSSAVLRAAGKIYAGLGDTREALHYYRLALEVGPGSPQLLFEMAELLMGEARYDSMAVVASEAIRQSPGGPPDWVWHPGYDFLAWALTLMARGSEILPVMQNAADRYGRDDPKFYVWLAREQCVAGQYRKAIKTCKRVLGKRTDRTGVSVDVTQACLRELGNAQWLSGDAEGALASFREASAADEKAGLTPGSEALISLLKYLGRFDEIDSRLDSMREGGRVDSWAWLAFFYYESMRRFDDALSAVDYALKSKEVTYSQYVRLHGVYCHQYKGDLKSAERAMRETETFLPSYQRSWFDLERADIAAVRGDLESALQFGNKAYGENSWHKDRNYFVTSLSEFYHALGRTREALDVLSRANGFDGGLEAYYRRVQLLAIIRSPEATPECHRVLALATRRSRRPMMAASDARMYGALAAARLGQRQRAKGDIEYALRMEPARADIAYGAACAYSLIGDTKKALDWLQTAVDRGHQELWWARVDPDLDNLRNLPRFKGIMDAWGVRMRALGGCS